MFLVRWLRFDGRISVGRFWLTYVLPLIAADFAMMGLDTMLFGTSGSILDQAPALIPSAAAAEYRQIVEHTYKYELLRGGPITAGWFWISVAPWLAGLTKRWHDRGRSGLWNLLLLVPFIGWFWMFISLGCRDGQRGPNRYGPDPVVPANHLTQAGMA